MRSFVKPSFAAKFGMATATSAAMAVSSVVALPASAATISVTTCDADGSSLLSAVATANASPAADVIEINISSNCTMTLNEAINITTSVTIDNIHPTNEVMLRRTNGIGRVLQAVVSTSSIDVVLEGLIISGTSFTDDTSRLMDFNGELAYPSNFTIRYTLVTGGYGGGLNVFDAVNLTVEDSTFSSNLNQNSARNGGAIRAIGSSDVTITNSTFSQNGYTGLMNGEISSETNGGALFIEGGDLTIAGSTFNANRSAWGGAIYAKDASVTFTGEVASVFNSNGFAYADLVASDLFGHGGAIDIHGESTFVANSPLDFIGNRSRNGGAIHFEIESDTTVEFNGTVNFTSNLAQNEGGAIRFYSYTENEDDDIQVDVEFNGATTNFTGNRAGGFYGSSGDGGAISIYENNDYSPYSGDEELFRFRFNSGTTTFTNNYAEDDGGAIYTDMEEGFAVFDFIDEHSRGLVYFTSNSTGDDGSAIYLEGGDDADGQAKLYLDGASFSGNTAASDGTIYLEDAAGYVYNSVFSSNSAVDGGVFYLEDDTNDAYLRAENSMFVNNSASGDGGVLYLEDATNFNLNGNVFWNNYSAGVGSVLAMDTNNTDANYLLFGQNTVYLNYAATESAALSLGQASYGHIFFNTFAINTSSSGSLALSVDHNSTYAGALNIYGNIFASTSDDAVVSTAASDDVNDLGFNLLTGPVGQSLNGGQTTVEGYDVALRDGRSLVVTWDQLALETIAVNDYNPDNASTLETMALGETSVAIDFLPTSVADWYVNVPEFDARGVTRVSGLFPASITPAAAPEVVHGLGIDAGAFESVHTFVPQDEEPVAVDPNVVITHVSKPSIQAAGDTITVYGRGLNDVTELYFNGVKVSFVKKADGSLLVTTPALPVGEVVVTAVASDGTAVLQHAFWVVDTLEFATWTRHVGDTIKIYAKNVIGRGKVQFFVDGKEIAWVNAVDATDPKLRTANGYHYLVRTVQLKADGSKTRFEVKLNGERVRRNTYTINSR